MHTKQLKTNIGLLHVLVHDILVDVVIIADLTPEKEEEYFLLVIGAILTSILITKQKKELSCVCALIGTKDIYETRHCTTLLCRAECLKLIIEDGV